MLVANSGGASISLFDAGGEFLGNFGPQDPSRLRFPDSLLVASNGELLISAGCRTTPGEVCDAKPSSIQRYSPSGAFLGTFTSAAESPLYRPYGMATGPDGLVYVASMMNNKILRYRQSGVFVDEFATGTGTDPFGLNGPNGLLFDGGSLYVTTEGSVPVHGEPTFPDGFPSLLIRYDVATRQSSILAQPSDPSNPPSLDNLRLGPDGNLYVSDFDLNLVRVYSRKGCELRRISTALDGLANQYTGGILFTPAGDLLASVGSQNEPILGAILQFSGTSHEDRSVLVPPTVNLDRPSGILLLHSRPAEDRKVSPGN
jgi:hypothetical protein